MKKIYLKGKILLHILFIHYNINRNKCLFISWPLDTLLRQSGLKARGLTVASTAGLFLSALSLKAARHSR